MSLTIKARRDGPYLVTGDLDELELTDAEGNRYDLTGKPNVALCRCGASATKPFCDASHKRIGFQAPEMAVESESDGAEI